MATQFPHEVTSISIHHYEVTVPTVFSPSEASCCVATGHVDSTPRRLFVYSRLTATNADGVQAGALHASVVHPGFTQREVPPLEHTQCWNNRRQSKVNWEIYFFKNNMVFNLSLKSGDLTSWVKVALHGCSRPTTGPQKKPCSCKHKVNPGELHPSSAPVGLWSAFSLCSLIYTSWGFTTAACRWGQHRHAAHRPGWRRCRRCHPLGNEEVVLYLGTALGTLEITSLCFSGHEPPKW